MNSSTATTPAPIHNAVCAWLDDSPKIDPNSTLTVAEPSPEPERSVVYIVRKNTPSPRIQAKTLPITTSSARPRRPSAPSSKATAIVAANSPTRRSTPNARAASAPVNATCDRASPVKTCARSTRKNPTAPQAAAMPVPPSSA